ncbi:MAG: hypothetical protein ACOYT8_05120 [Candidatus Dependentiae bacterium]
MSFPIISSEKSLTKILSKDFNLGKKRVENLFNEARMLPTKEKRACFLKDFCIRHIHKNIDQAARNLQNRVVDIQKIKQAANEIKKMTTSASGIVNEDGLINKKKLLLYAPDNLECQLLDQISDICCPVCYEYYAIDVIGGTAQKIFLGCHPTHTICSKDVSSLFTKEQCPHCRQRISINSIRQQINLHDAYQKRDQFLKLKEQHEKN